MPVPVVIPCFAASPFLKPLTPLSFRCQASQELVVVTCSNRKLCCRAYIAHLRDVSSQ